MEKENKIKEKLSLKILEKKDFRNTHANLETNQETALTHYLYNSNKAIKNNFEKIKNMITKEDLKKAFKLYKMIIHGYSEEELKKLPDDSMDLIITSPPYADRRKNTYGGISEDKYLEWFKPIAIEIKRILKPTGSFFLNIKPHTNKGERSLYVFELVIMLKRELGFLFVEEYCWTKNAFPGGFKGRFKNAFEPVYHFTKGNPNQITFNPIACGTPMKEESIARTYRKQCGAPKNGSGMTAMNTTNIRNLEFARPSNVINVNNVSNQFTLKSDHSATFPEKLVEFFVKSFSNEGDTVLDLFAGSGTVGMVCEEFNRNYILIDKEETNIQLIKKRLKIK